MHDITQTPALDVGHDAGMLRHDGLSLRLAGLEQFHDAQQTADLIFQHFQHGLNGAHFLALRAFRLFQSDDTALDVVMQFAQVVLPLLLHVSNAGQDALGGDTARVEGTHRQLRSGFADGLRRNNTRRHADVHQPPERQVAAIALGADALPQFARQHGAHMHTHGGRDLEQRFGPPVCAVGALQCARPPDAFGTIQQFPRRFRGHGVTLDGPPFRCRPASRFRLSRYARRPDCAPPDPKCPHWQA